MNMPGDNQASPSETQAREQMEAMSLYESYEVRSLLSARKRQTFVPWSRQIMLRRLFKAWRSLIPMS